MSRMQDLIDKLNKASEDYYNGTESMSNKEFDEGVEELQKMEKEEGVVLPNSPTVNVGYPVSGDLPRFKHTYPALSLDKTKNKDTIISSFKQGIIDSGSDNDNVVCMFKEDGCTLQVYYKDGKLERLTTRGDGEVGLDITHNAKVIKGIPQTVPFNGEFVVRGEALISYSDFDRINDQLPPDVKRYENPRNLAATSVQLVDPEKVASRNVVMKAFALVHFDGDPDVFESFATRLYFLEEAGFDVVEHIKCSVDKLSEAMDQMSSEVEKYPYPVDGLVIAMDNYAYSSTLPGTEHHPNIMQGYSFKWKDECKDAIVREIEWSPSRTGRLNPVAIFDPVRLEGTSVERASLHNLSIMRKLRIRVGSRISVYKSNKIIPKVDENLTYDEDPEYTDESIKAMISVCPVCGKPVSIHETGDNGKIVEMIYCDNERCPEKFIGKFTNFCSREALDIRGMSEETVKKLVEAGFIKNYSDFFRLGSKPEIAQLPGFGDQSWKKLVNAAEESSTTDFVRFFVGMGIPDIGKGQLKALKKYLLDNYESIADEYRLDPVWINLPYMLSVLGQKDFDFTKIDGFGEILSVRLSTWLKQHFDISDLSKETTDEEGVFFILNFTDIGVIKREPVSNIFEGKIFSITGKLSLFKNRAELVKHIESLGGKWVDSVSRNTAYLINNDINSTSGKNGDAKALGVPIISEEDYLKMVSEN